MRRGGGACNEAESVQGLGSGSPTRWSSKRNILRTTDSLNGVVGTSNISSYLISLSLFPGFAGAPDSESETVVQSIGDLFLN